MLGLCCRWHIARRQAEIIRKAAARCATAAHLSDFGLLRNLQGVIDIDAEVTNSALQLGMAKQQLYGPEILRALVDQSCLGSPQRMRPVGGWVQAGRCNAFPVAVRCCWPGQLWRTCRVQSL